MLNSFDRDQAGCVQHNRLFRPKRCASDPAIGGGDPHIAAWGQQIAKGDVLARKKSDGIQDIGTSDRSGSRASNRSCRRLDIYRSRAGDVVISDILSLNIDSAHGVDKCARAEEEIAPRNSGKGIDRRICVDRRIARAIIGMGGGDILCRGERGIVCDDNLTCAIHVEVDVASHFSIKSAIDCDRTASTFKGQPAAGCCRIACGVYGQTTKGNEARRIGREIADCDLSSIAYANRRSCAACSRRVNGDIAQRDDPGTAFDDFDQRRTTRSDPAIARYANGAGSIIAAYAAIAAKALRK